MIRSVIVPVANVVSNVLQLMALGVPLRDIQNGFKTKLVEINQHLANEAHRVEIGAEMAQHKPNSMAYRKLETELKSLDDANKRMTIWPLIEAGEFSTISEGLTEADAAIGQGEWAQWMQEKIDSLPQKLGTAGRYLAVTRDTALPGHVESGPVRGLPR